MTLREASAALTTPRAFPSFSDLRPAQVGTLPRRANERESYLNTQSHDRANHSPADHPATTPQATQATNPTSVSDFSYITSSPYVPSELFAASTGTWPYVPNSNSPSIFVDTATSPTWQLSTNFPIPFTETPHSIESFSPVESYVTPSGRPQYQQQLQTPSTQSIGSTLSTLGYSLPLELQTDMQNYPSPQYSDVSGPTFAAHQTIMQGPIMSPSIPVATSPSLDRSSESRQSSHKSPGPTRNTDGLLFCNHPEHGYNAPTFARKCEWR